MGAIIVGLAFIVGLFLWCRWVPDEQARVRGFIVVVLLIPVVDVAAYVLNRIFGFY